MSDLGVSSLQEADHKPQHKHARSCLAVLVALAVIVALGAFAYVKGVDLIRGVLSGPPDYSGAGHGSVIVKVKKGTLTDIGVVLQKSDVVKSVQAFTDAAKTSDSATSIQPGFYRLHKQMSGQAALALLLDPKSKVVHLLTIPEGYRTSEIRAVIAAKTRLDKAEISKAYADTKALGLPSYAHGDAEGYLFPATYNVTPGISARQLLAQMVARFKQEAKADGLTKAAHALHLAPGKVVIVASLVQAEARRAKDMPKVARVVYNRLKIGVPLQFDSTLHYAVNSRGVVVTGGRLRSLKSPYNTYLHAGLPPTAIDSPGAVALKAAMHPAPGSWRYFVTVNLRTGDTRFATTLAQHERNVKLYRDYCRTSDAC